MSWFRHQSHQSSLYACYQIVIELLSNLVSLHDPFYKAKYRNIVPGTRIRTDEEVAVPRQASSKYCDQELLLTVRFF